MKWGVLKMWICTIIYIIYFYAKIHNNFYKIEHWTIGLKRLSHIHNEGQTRKTVCFFYFIYIYIYIIKSHCLALQALNHWFSQPKKKKGIEPLTLEKLICISLKSEAWLAMYYRKYDIGWHHDIRNFYDESIE